MSVASHPNPWISIWLHPKETVRALTQGDPRSRLAWLSFLYGLPMALNFAQSYSLIEVLPLWAILCLSAILSPFIGFLGICFSSWLLNISGKVIGGQGNFQEIRCAVAWSNVPTFFTVLMWVVLFSVFGSTALYRDFAQIPFTGALAGILFLVFLIESIAAIWGFVILLKGLSEVQKFSVWKALLNVMIPVVAICTALWIVARLF